METYNLIIISVFILALIVVVVTLIAQNMSLKNEVAIKDKEPERLRHFIRELKQEREEYFQEKRREENFIKATQLIVNRHRRQLEERKAQEQLEYERELNKLYNAGEEYAIPEMTDRKLDKILLDLTSYERCKLEQKLTNKEKC